MKKMPVHCPEARQKYNGKPVLIWIEQTGQLIQWRGVFRVHSSKDAALVFLDVDEIQAHQVSIASSMRPGDTVHLSQDYVDSVTTTVLDGGSEIFEVKKPLLEEDHVYRE